MVRFIRLTPFAQAGMHNLSMEKIACRTDRISRAVNRSIRELRYNHQKSYFSFTSGTTETLRSIMAKETQAGGMGLTARTERNAWKVPG